MKILKITFFIWFVILLLFFGPITNEAAVVETAITEYEQYYPKFVDSKEPLITIKAKDLITLAKAKKKLRSQRVPFPIKVSYGNFANQQLNIYQYPGNGLNPVIFFIHAGYTDKKSVVYTNTKFRIH